MKDADTCIRVLNVDGIHFDKALNLLSDFFR